MEGNKILKGGNESGMGRGSAYKALSLAFLAARLVLWGRSLVEAAGLKKESIAQMMLVSSEVCDSKISLGLGSVRVRAIP